MKKLFVLFGIALGIGIFSQCLRNTEPVAVKSDSLALRTTSCVPEMDPEFSCTIESDVYIQVEVDVDIPGIPSGTIGDCAIWAQFDIETCVKQGGGYTYYKKHYTNFRMVIPDNNDCTALNSFLDNLANNDPDTYDDVMNELENYVAEKGKDNNMVKFVIDNNLTCGGASARVVESQMILTGCYKRCVEVIAWEEGDPRGYTTRGRNTARKYYTMSCGEGCCVTNVNYCLDSNGDIVRSDVYSYGVGDCTGLNYFDACIPLHWKERGCYKRCPN